MGPTALSTHSPNEVSISHSPFSSSPNNTTLTILSTHCLSAIELTLHHDKHIIPCQALLDSGADANCMTYKLANTLGATITSTNIAVSPVGGAHIKCYGISEITTTINDKKVILQFLILDQIGSYGTTCLFGL